MMPGEEEKRSKGKEKRKSRKKILSTVAGLFGPTTESHALLNSSPDTLDDLTITPATTTLRTILLVPAFNSEVLHAAAPALDLARDILPPPSDVNTSGVLEQLGWGRPLVRLELPGLAGSEDGHKAVPVLGLEVGGAVDDDELCRSGGLGAAPGADCAGVWIRGVSTERALQLHEVCVGCAG